jgi:hypothetical protein
MKTAKLIVLIGLQLIAIAVVMMAISYLTDYLQHSGFFGDRLATTDEINTRKGDYVWGYRHWIYFITGFCLFTLSIIRLCLWIEEKTNKS